MNPVLASRGYGHRSHSLASWVVPRGGGLPSGQLASGSAGLWKFWSRKAVTWQGYPVSRALRVGKSTDLGRGRGPPTTQVRQGSPWIPGGALQLGGPLEDFTDFGQRTRPLFCHLHWEMQPLGALPAGQRNVPVPTWDPSVCCHRRHSPLLVPPRGLQVRGPAVPSPADSRHDDWPNYLDSRNEQ